MISYDITRPDGTVYITVEHNGRTLCLKGIGPDRIDVNLDAKVTEPLLEALQYIKFVNWVKNGT